VPRARAHASRARVLDTRMPVPMIIG